MNSITQDMKYRQSLMEYSRKYGVARASRRYNRCRSYIYFWLERYGGTLAYLRPKSKRPHSHPRQHTEAEIKLITELRRRNPDLGMIELRNRMRQRGYSRCPESLYRNMRKLNMFPNNTENPLYRLI